MTVAERLVGMLHNITVEDLLKLADDCDITGDECGKVLLGKCMRNDLRSFLVTFGGRACRGCPHENHEAGRCISDRCEGFINWLMMEASAETMNNYNGNWYEVKDNDGNE